MVKKYKGISLCAFVASIQELKYCLVLLIELIFQHSINVHILSFSVLYFVLAKDAFSSERSVIPLIVNMMFPFPTHNYYAFGVNA